MKTSPLASFFRRFFRKHPPPRGSDTIFVYDAVVPIAIRATTFDGKRYHLAIDYLKETLACGVFDSLDDAMTHGYIAAGRLSKTLALMKPRSTA